MSKVSDFLYLNASVLYSQFRLGSLTLQSNLKELNDKKKGLEGLVKTRNFWIVLSVLLAHFSYHLVL